MDPSDLCFFAMDEGFLVLPLHGRQQWIRAHRSCHFFTGGRGRFFTSGWGCWSPRQPSPHRRRGSPGHRPGPSAPAPCRAPAASAGSASTERTRTARPPYTDDIVFNGQRNSASLRLPPPPPPEEPPRRPLIFRIRRPGYNETGVGVIPNSTSPTVVATGIAGFGPQAGPSNASGRHTVTNFTGATMDVHPSFIFGTRAALRGAPPHPNPGGSSTATASAASAASAAPGASTEAAPLAPTPARLFGRVAAKDRRSGIRRGTWSPAALGLSSGH
ncbi:hypothetical protein C2845_PM03G34310 [Panicum miliaceum]|uniref:Uncharacterized protein n=1 Tax=Panicum miliaceum TaxID=4540 RepID=A0A3L6T5D3_PANMI|nr:hypothetical protein C2845_PM03G34310 [Panicum miliaceum]